jgi:hypothetical protein
MLKVYTEAKGFYKRRRFNQNRPFLSFVKIFNSADALAELVFKSNGHHYIAASHTIFYRTQ